LAISIAWNIAVIAKNLKQNCVNPRYILAHLLEGRSGEFLFPLNKADIPKVLEARIQLGKRLAASMLIFFVAASIAQSLCG
jgi:hypothetical protein